MGNLHRSTIHVSRAFMGLSVIAVGIATPCSAGQLSSAPLRGGDRGAMEAMSTGCVENDFVTVAESTGPAGKALRGGLARAARDGYAENTVVIMRLTQEGARRRALNALKRAMKREATSPGFVGAELGTSRKCGTARLLSVWQNEPSTLDAATSSAFTTPVERRPLKPARAR